MGDAKHVGFTGTRSDHAVAPARLRELELRLTELRGRGATNFHHGDCVGMDEIAAELAREAGFRLIAHPPSDPKQRAYVASDVVCGEKGYLDRNRDIVEAVDVLLAVPRNPANEPRSTRGNGTWTTIRYGRKAAIPVDII